MFPIGIAACGIAPDAGFGILFDGDEASISVGVPLFFLAMLFEIFARKGTLIKHNDKLTSIFGKFARLNNTPRRSGHSLEESRTDMELAREELSERIDRWLASIL